MAKTDDYLPSQKEVDHVLYCDKTVNFSGVRWGNKPPPNRPLMWLQMQVIPEDNDGIPIQGLSFLLQWKPDHDSLEITGSSYPKINIVALYNKKRVFAVDTYPFDKHKNNYKIDRPDYQDTVFGAHFHVYYEEAGYYSERIGFPIVDSIKPDDLSGYWEYFCKRLNVTCLGKLPLPLEDESGQIGLGL
ncbi:MULTISPECIES: hypothetical protein [Enterobacteriaceae]|uniref:hypothetical protein n=1 Tax=Enterobacteriaceae TaxID=543 RepID=UPI0015B00F2E|nr:MULTISPECIES: hypothetical protein [Enterobacteriaceae]EKS8398483.1 hypothetical protein [Escherichia coli]EKX8778027.1 hypothetical protein [Citrobacter freundii]MBJ9826248.1 hypothetical protein [Citrobacter koseri]MCK6678676.1 hypothetical protein [Enterobacter asburiae]MDH0752570.1 hypothetical protein [Citrobacter freundii]